MSHSDRQDPTVRVRPAKIRTPGQIGWPGPRVHVVNGKLVHHPAESRRLDCFSPPITLTCVSKTTHHDRQLLSLQSTQSQLGTNSPAPAPEQQTIQCLRSASSRGPRASAHSATQPPQDQPHPDHHHHRHRQDHHFPPPRAPTPQPSNKAPPRLACPQTSRPSSSASSAPWPTASPTRRPCLTSSNNSSRPPPCRPPRHRGTQPRQTGQLQRRHLHRQQQQNYHRPTSPPQAACGAARPPSSTARGTQRRARSAGPRRSR